MKPIYTHFLASFFHDLSAEEDTNHYSELIDFNRMPNAVVADCVNVIRGTIVPLKSPDAGIGSPGGNPTRT